jgi:hypothetical protein
LSIDNKNEETQKLREYIVMEQEKIAEAKKTFEEDCERFSKYLNEIDTLKDKA